MHPAAPGGVAFTLEEEMPMKLLIAASVAACALAAGCANLGGSQQDKVVYHLNEGLDQASNGLRNINNHLEVNPQAKIVVVSHARGVDFLMKGTKDKNGNNYEDLVERLKTRGVQFDVCQITLRNRKLSKDQFIEYATFVPSGVAEVTRLQQREGYAYLRP
jgi:intracellular sulfur oxidation DsrE/DsrF family protein